MLYRIRTKFRTAIVFLLLHLVSSPNGKTHLLWFLALPLKLSEYQSLPRSTSGMRILLDERFVILSFVFPAGTSSVRGLFLIEAPVGPLSLGALGFSLLYGSNGRSDTERASSMLLLFAKKVKKKSFKH